MKNFLSVCIAVVFLLKAAEQVNAGPLIKHRDRFLINLEGKWGFQIDSLNKGIKQKWFLGNLDDKINLPGSMTENGKGNDITLTTPWTGSIFDSSYFRKPVYEKYRQPGNIKVPFWLQPDKYYKGAAWYQKTISIPANWGNKHIELYLERVHWETKVWIDDQFVGMQNSLAVPHIYDLSRFLKPGIHRLTILVDNSIKEINVGPNSHSITDHTQTNWNGIVGRLALRARPMAYVDDIQIFPDVKNKQVNVELKLIRCGTRSRSVGIDLDAVSNSSGAPALKGLNKTTVLTQNETTVKLVYPMGGSPLLWDEFHPHLYRMKVSLRSGSNGPDIQTRIFGMRSFKTSGTNFTINGKPTFLRGSLECAAFPRTGYPPTDVPSWMEELRTCKSYGLNHLRFHSWCPPEAAFVAADSLGMYLQIECSSWANWGTTIGDGKPIDEYIYRESRAIVKAYGNHPSFCMLTYGNEPAGKNLVAYLTNFVKYWKAKDSGRLYSTGAGWPVIDESDYNSTPEPRIQHWEEGLKSVINNRRPSTDYDWSAIISKWQHPTVSHEIGQWCVYPDFGEIAKYDGVLKAKNFEIFRDQLSANGLAGLAEDFLYSSGKLQTLCYKADIEAALRTKGFGGFQLLGLSDFPGQGTALVGALNAFWKPKSYVNGADYSQFCNAVVPLARFPKMVYLNNEELDVPIEIAQYSSDILKGVTPKWEISAESGNVLFSGDFGKTNISNGNGIALGRIKQSLNKIAKPSRLILTVYVDQFKNSWDFFVYPKTLPKTNESILVTHELDATAIDVLNKGGKVLLTLRKGTLKAAMGGDIAIGFSTIFWNTAWTHSQPPVTLGIYCDPKNPAFNNFPTQKFSNWQWWDAMSHSNAIKLDSVAPGLKPLLRVIDDWVTARSLGLIFECRVGAGKLLVSGIDLTTDGENRPEARQLLYSLTDYMGTSAFAPEIGVDQKKIYSLYK